MRTILTLDRGRCIKERISEGTNRDSDMILPPFQDVMHGGTAAGTEGEGDPSAGIPGPNEIDPLPLDADSLALETRLHPEGAARPALARLAVTNRHPCRCAGDMGAELPAATDAIRSVMVRGTSKDDTNEIRISTNRSD